VLALFVTAVASVVVFLLMRYPSLRRPQFQGGRAFSVAASLTCALGLFALLAALTWMLQAS
jgi:hypothetical protein